MDDFSIYRGTFNLCLENLIKVLRRCEKVNVVLNWEKCHFMVQKGVVQGHAISDMGIEVDKAMIEVIERLLPSTSLKGMRSFLGHAGFYRHFIKNFSNIAKPLTQLLAKDAPFVFTDECHEAFYRIKKTLIFTPIIQPPDWDLRFEIMCDAGDHTMGAISGQRRDKKPIVICYAARTLDETQHKYTTTEKKLLAVVYVMEKFHSYLLCFKVIVYTDHLALKHLLEKKDGKLHLIRWILLL